MPVGGPQGRQASPTVQLNLTGETEEACRIEDPDLGCRSIFQPAFIHASTGAIELELQEGSPTPTATPTLTPTATATRRASDDEDGCAIARPEQSGIGGLGILLLPVLLLARRLASAEIPIVKLDLTEKRSTQRRRGAEQRRESHGVAQVLQAHQRWGYAPALLTRILAQISASLR